MLNFLILFLSFQAAAYAQVNLDSAVVTGIVNATLIKYLGIPFAHAPRFNLPQPVAPYTVNFTADAYGPGCIQQSIILPLYTGPESEDCLSINVIKPAAVTNDEKVPVLVWFFGGGFQLGASAQPEYDDMATDVVSRSVELGKPVIFVSLNYRLSAYGFLASQEVANEGIGNFALHDQRVGLQWVKRYIDAFGGDPSLVTLWGQSSGAISAALHMTAYGGRSDDLFRGVFMQSGAPIPVGPIQNGQKYYDDLVTETNCTDSTNTLECLRTVPLDALKMAVDKSPNVLSYQALHLAWLPRVDGDFIPSNPYDLVAQGKIVDVPTVSGTCDDEGTFFSVFGPSNTSSDADFQNYVRTVWLPRATEAELAPLWTHYPDDPSQGSPFGEPNVYAAYGQYYRVSAFQGDVVFQSPRRLFTEALAKKTSKAWVYLSKKFKNSTFPFPLVPYPVGSYHGTDLADFTRIHAVHFANNLDPNTGSNGTTWPTYITGIVSPQILTFVDGPEEAVVVQDEYRGGPLEYLRQLAIDHPL